MRFVVTRDKMARWGFVFAAYFQALHDDWSSLTDFAFSGKDCPEIVAVDFDETSWTSSHTFRNLENERIPRMYLKLFHVIADRIGGIYRELNPSQGSW